MAQHYGMTAEMYKAITALVDERVKEIMVTRQDFNRLAEEQVHIEDRLNRVEAALDRLIEAHIRAEERLTRLEATVEKLAEAQARTEEQVRALTEAQARTEKQVRALTAAQTRTEETIARILDTLGDLKGRQLEQDYRDKAYAYFGTLLRQLRVVSLQELEEDLLLHLSEQQLDELRPLDLLVRGRPRQKPDAPEVWLAVEISALVDRYDVERAQQRAATLRRAGYRAIPTVAGERVVAGVDETARDSKVLLLQDGRARFWTEALEEALAL